MLQTSNVVQVFARMAYVATMPAQELAKNVICPARLDFARQFPSDRTLITNVLQVRDYQEIVTAFELVLKALPKRLRLSLSGWVTPLDPAVHR